ncbi:MAG: hydroxymethylglutaryl-CoA lyase [Firmicutes bacterium]|nr:hydroxymethylglutaryl-CoA lyase [Bacillota bacterium]
MQHLQILWPDSIDIREVSPRDGLQAEPQILPTEQKVELIKKLGQAGLRRIEAASFVHPKWLPQMADAEEVMRQIPRSANIRYSVLVPNLAGLERALGTKPDEITVFVSASETHNRKNVNRSIEESVEGFKTIVSRSHVSGVEVSAVIVTAFGCPYEGAVPVSRILDLIDQFQGMGIRQVTLGDTVGTANPRQVYHTIKTIYNRFPDIMLGLHFHDNRGTALANMLAAISAGATYFDTALGGIGGSPFSPGAGGNLATEDLVYILEESGISTRVELSSLIATGDLLEQWIGHELPSRVHRARGRMVPVSGERQE